MKRPAPPVNVIGVIFAAYLIGALIVVACIRAVA